MVMRPFAKRLWTFVSDVLYGSYEMVSVKPDPDNAFPRSAGSSLPHIDDAYLAASRVFAERSRWLSSPPPPLQTHVDDSRRQGVAETSTGGWATVGRQHFPDIRDAPPRLEENFAAADPLEEYRQRGESSPEPWRRVEEDPSPPALPPATAVDGDPYRTVTGHHRGAAAEPGPYRPEADDDGGPYRPRRLLADFYRYAERQDRRPPPQEEASVDDQPLMGETGRWVKAASAYDGSPPVDRESNYLNGRRLTWPFGASPVPSVRRRQAAADAPYQQYYIDEDRDKVDRPAARLSAADTAAAAASPISRLIQRYDHHHSAMTSSSGSQALPGATSMHHAAGRADWFPLSWQPPPITCPATVDGGGSAAENSTSISDNGEGIKTYSCHICSYIGESVDMRASSESMT